MVTATCKNDDCKESGTPYDLIGEPTRVECGLCHVDCELTNYRDDPPPPDTAEFPDPPTGGE